MRFTLGKNERTSMKFKNLPKKKEKRIMPIFKHYCQQCGVGFFGVRQTKFCDQGCDGNRSYANFYRA